MMSLALTPGGELPSTVIAIVLNGLSGSVWVASTCSTSLVPMPNASAPNAPWVDVCESPQTMVIPGWVSPSCGPTTCTMPCSGVAHRVEPDAELGAVGAQRLDLQPGDRILDQQIAADERTAGHRAAAEFGRDVVVLGGERQIGPADRAAGQPQAVERLRAGHLVDQVQVDEEQVGLTLRGVHDVCVPDLLGQRPPHCRPPFLECRRRDRPAATGGELPAVWTSQHAGI